MLPGSNCSELPAASSIGRAQQFCLQQSNHCAQSAPETFAQMNGVLKESVQHLPSCQPRPGAAACSSTWGQEPMEPLFLSVPCPVWEATDPSGDTWLHSKPSVSHCQVHARGHRTWQEFHEKKRARTGTLPGGGCRVQAATEAPRTAPTPQKAAPGLSALPPGSWCCWEPAAVAQRWGGSLVLGDTQGQDG